MSEYTEGVMIDIDKLKEFRSACGFSYMPRDIPQEAIDILKQQGITLFSLCEVGELSNEKLIGYFSIQRIPLDVAEKFVDICKEKTGASFRAEEYGVSPNERTGFESE